MDEEKTLTYRQEGDYLIPDLDLPDSGRTYGKYGILRRTYLQERRPGTYSAMLLQGTLWDHLADVDEEAMEQVSRLLKDMMQEAGATEDLKARDMMGWVGLVNNLKQRAEEQVLQELIYT